MNNVKLFGGDRYYTNRNQDLKKNLSSQIKTKDKMQVTAKEKKHYLHILQNQTGSQYRKNHVIFTDNIQQQPTVLCINQAGIRKKTVHLFLLLCRTLVYLHLEHCTQVLSLYLQKDVVKLERVQSTATVKNKGPYKQMLKCPELLSMERKWKRG